MLAAGKDSMRRRLVIFTDGAARGNPGPSASGFVAFENGKVVRREEAYNGEATNNLAEYRAIAAALEWCAKFLKDPKSAHVSLNSDSELVVRQLNGEYKTKSAQMKAMNRKVSRLAGAFGMVVFENVRRSNRYASEVDKALNRLLDEVAAAKNRQTTDAK